MDQENWSGIPLKVEKKSAPPSTGANKPKVPSVSLRTCVGCRATKASSAMVRLCLDGSGVLFVAKSSAGRGAWLCKDSKCFKLAGAKGKLERVFRVARLADVQNQLSSIYKHLGF